MGNIPWELFDYGILWPFGENRLPSSPDSSGRIEAPAGLEIHQTPGCFEGYHVCGLGNVIPSLTGWEEGGGRLFPAIGMAG